MTVNIDRRIKRTGGFRPSEKKGYWGFLSSVLFVAQISWSNCIDGVRSFSEVRSVLRVYRSLKMR